MSRPRYAHPMRLRSSCLEAAKKRPVENMAGGNDARCGIWVTPWAKRVPDRSDVATAGETTSGQIAQRMSRSSLRQRKDRHLDWEAVACLSRHSSRIRHGHARPAFEPATRTLGLHPKRWGALARLGHVMRFIAH